MEKTNNPAEPPDLDPELFALLERGMQGDLSCVPELRRALDEHPELVDQLGGVVQHIQRGLITRVASNLLVEEVLSYEVGQLRAELRATATTPIEKLLAERVAITWLDVNICNTELINRQKSQPVGLSAVQAAESRLDRAQARFLAATKALATAQKHLRPTPSALELFGGEPTKKQPRGMTGQRRSFNPANQGLPISN
jgi:hypothetical protein